MYHGKSLILAYKFLIIMNIRARFGLFLDKNFTETKSLSFLSETS
ncbi:hypothetical protein BRYFOR_09454 [Marvinbryantia formatexigens DSM 14469]|uniref:Uncharacterized protein n=1 Tax=Marvinbryantia formatexigens DSM 14469 TaxID=478749 RepID=C6LLA7_9FIRM|nr:hypothetical protein BRYFOR_09454 [Marvinbryantia formatexigens DSM 14469]